MASKYGYMAKIGADTSGLTAALSDIENSLKNTSAELKAVNAGLKLDGGENTENLKNKFDLLGTAIESTKNKLEQLRSAEEAVKKAAESGDISASEQKKYQQEIANTESRLRQYEQELANTKLQLDNAGKSTDDATKETKELEKAVDNAGKSAVGFGDIFKANILSDVVMSGLRRLKDEFVDFAKQGIELASNLSEVQNVVDTTFGSDADKINTWAANAATSFGMSELAAKQYTGTLGAMLKSQGITSDSVVELSENLVGLAGDMASFYNLDIETAFEKIRSGISGETEPLKQLGINMSVTNMEAYALAEGIEKPWRKMSQQEQTMLRYQYLLKATADAQGDFAKTSDSYANQQRIMELTMQNLSAELGEKLLPVSLELTQLISSSAPSIMNDIEGIGDAAVSVAKCLIEHKEAVAALAASYVAFKGASAVGSAVSTAVNAFKTLTTATKAATAAQEVNNAVAAANPYILLASALAAVTVGLVTLASTADTTHNRLKNINDDIKDIKKSSEESIEAAEDEIAVIKEKAKEYEELLNTQNRTAGQEEKLKARAEELQQYMPEGTQLIDEQTGAYNSLAGSIDSVTEAMRRKATLSAYEDEYTALIQKQIAVQKEIEEMEARKAESGTYTDPSEWIWGVGSALADDSVYKDAKNQLSEITSDIENLDQIINQFYEDEATGAAGAVSAASNGARIAAEGRAQQLEEEARENAEKQDEELKKYEENLQAKVDKLDEKLALRKISEAEYYTELKKYLDDHVNTESEAYYKQLSAYEKYTEEQKKQAEKAAEEQKKQDEQDAKERKKAYEDSIDDQIDELKLKNEIDESYTEEMMWNEIEIIVNGLDKQSDQYKKYNSEILKGRKKLADDIKKEDEKAAKEELEEWEKTSKEMSQKLESSYKDIVTEKQKAKDDLLDIDLSDTVTNSNGKDVNVLTDLNDEIKKMDKYRSSLEKLKKTDISDSLMEKIMGMNYEDGSRQAFIDTLLGLSSEKLQLYYSDWERLQEKAEQTAQDQISGQLDDLNTETANTVSSIFGSMPKSAYEDGAATAQSYIQGIIDNMGGLNDAKVISSILGIGNNDTQISRKTPYWNTDVSSNTPIVINLNDKEYINTTIGEIISSGKRSGGNTFNL